MGVNPLKAPEYLKLTYATILLSRPLTSVATGETLKPVQMIQTDRMEIPCRMVENRSVMPGCRVTNILMSRMLLIKTIWYSGNLEESGRATELIL